MDTQPAGHGTNQSQSHQSDQQIAAQARGRPVRRIILDSSIIVISGLFFATSSPRGTPSLVLLAGFLAIAASITALFDILIQLSGISGRLSIHYRRIVYMLVAVVPALLLLLQSLGQLAVRDAAVIVLLVIVGVFYVGKQAKY